MPVPRRRGSNASSVLSSISSNPPRPTLAVPLASRNKRLRRTPSTFDAESGSTASTASSSARPPTSRRRVSISRSRPTRAPRETAGRRNARKTRSARGSSSLSELPSEDDASRSDHRSQVSYTVRPHANPTHIILRPNRYPANASSTHTSSPRIGGMGNMPGDEDGQVDVDQYLDFSGSRAQTPFRSTSPRSNQSISRHTPNGFDAGEAIPIASSSTSSSQNDKNSTEGRRYTAAEKGKGRAIQPTPIEIDDDEDPEEEKDQGFEIVDVVKKSTKGIDAGQDGLDDDLADFDTVEEETKGDNLTKRHKVVVDPEKSLSAYTCPVCFGAPEEAVMTPCGHVLCNRCLFDSLVASIKRKSDYPVRTPAGRRGRGGRGRGRGRAIASYLPGRDLTHSDVHPLGGPEEWTEDTLKNAWMQHKHREYNRRMDISGIIDEERDAFREHDAEAPKEDETKVIERMKGVWQLDGSHWVIEGECPVCRKNLPGGYGPPHSGIGGIVRLRAKVST